MKSIFYDTCSLLMAGEHLFDNVDKEDIYISSITLRELEEIKTSDKKDADVKYAARHLLRVLDGREDDYTVIIYTSNLDKIIEANELPNNNDSKILATAYNFKKEQNLEEFYFCTNDLCLKKIALMFFNKKYIISINDIEPEDDYTGFKEITYKDDEDLAQIYADLFNAETAKRFGCLTNEYLFIKSPEGKIVDKYKNTVDGFEQLQYQKTESYMFGKVTPKDEYQTAVLDSFKNNQITLVRGPAGGGKSMLSLAYLFEQLEKRKIEKIVVFCNTIAAAGAAKLGLIK